MREMILGAISLTFLLAGCGEEEPVVVAGPELQELEAEQVMIGVEQFLTSDGVRRARVSADTVLVLPDDSRIHLRNLTIRFLGAQGEELSVLTARRGVYDTRTEDMEAAGNVVVVQPLRGRRLETERLEYAARTDRLHGDTTFVFTQGGTTTRGASFVTDPSLDRVEIERPSVVAPRVEVPE
ncbi:MAG: LPS export ABC transporter periplasmic protein LptC [Gemmatimonadota bacterium]